jgi:hypothetical protein
VKLEHAPSVWEDGPGSGRLTGPGREGSLRSLAAPTPRDRSRMRGRMSAARPRASRAHDEDDASARLQRMDAMSLRARMKDGEPGVRLPLP